VAFRVPAGRLQVELHPVLRQDELLAACAKLGTHLTAYSPLGSPDSATMFKHDGASVLDHATVAAVAGSAGKTAGQVLIRWAIQRGTSVVPKSVTPSRIEANFDVLSWELTDEQMAQLSAINPQVRARTSP
jgi:alcohol dehydrogenase (NADP+)